MNPQLRKGLIIGFLGISAISVISYFKKQFNLLKNACYAISGGVIHNLSLDSVKMTLFLKIVNESDLTVQLSNMNFNIYVNKMFVTNIKKDDIQTLYSLSDTIVKLDFEFNPKDLLRAGITNIEPIIYDKEKLIVTIKGSVSVKAGVLKISHFPIEEEITLKELLAPSPDSDRCKAVLKKK